MEPGGGTTLSEREVYALYIRLKRDEMALDVTLSALLNRIEKMLQAELTIEEMESVETVFKKKFS